MTLDGGPRLDSRRKPKGKQNRKKKHPHVRGQKRTKGLKSSAQLDPLFSSGLVRGLWGWGAKLIKPEDKYPSRTSY